MRYAPSGVSAEEFATYPHHPSAVGWYINGEKSSCGPKYKIQILRGVFIQNMWFYPEESGLLLLEKNPTKKSQEKTSWRGWWRDLPTCSAWTCGAQWKMRGEARSDASGGRWMPPCASARAGHLSASGDVSELCSGWMWRVREGGGEAERWLSWWPVTDGAIKQRVCSSMGFGPYFDAILAAILNRRRPLLIDGRRHCSHVR